MNCPQCGYLMDTFDSVCPKCHGRGLKPQKAKKPPSSNSIAPLPAMPLSTSNPVAPPAPVNAVPVDAAPRKLVLICPVCDSKDVQKVSAIFDAGTQRSSSSGTTSGTSMGVGYVWGSGPVPVFGVNSSKTYTNHSSQTHLASLLRPPSRSALPPAPPKPQPPVLKRANSGVGEAVNKILLWVWLALPGALLYVVGYRPGPDFGGTLFWLTVSPVLFHILIAVLCFLRDGVDDWVALGQHQAKMKEWREQRPGVMAEWSAREAAWRAECAAIQAGWHRREAAWKRLFYCSRCDHVHDVETGAAAPASRMESVL